MTWAFQSPGRPEVGRRFYRPALESLEDRLAPGDALGWFSLTAISGPGQPNLAVAGATATEGQGSTEALRPGETIARTDSVGRAGSRDGGGNSLTPSGRTGSPTMTVSPLAADWVFRSFDELFPCDAGHRHPAPLPANPSGASRFQVAAGALPTPPPRGDATWSPSPSRSIEPRADRIGPVVVPPSALWRAAGTTGRAALVKVTASSVPTLHAGRQRFGLEATPLVETEDANFGNAINRLAAAATDSSSFETVVGPSNSPNGSVEVLVRSLAGTLPSFEAVVVPPGPQVMAVGVAATLPTPAGTTAPPPGVVTPSIAKRQPNSIPFHSSVVLSPGQAAPAGGSNGNHTNGSASIAPAGTVATGTSAGPAANGHVPPAAGGPVMNAAQRKALALGLRYLNPEMTDEAIAHAAGVSRRTLFRWAEYNALKRAQRGIFNLPRGYKTAAGDIEAWTEED